MMRSFINKSFLMLLILLAPIVTQAAVTTWQIIPAESSIAFTGTQNNAPISGNFKKFTGEISVDSDHLEMSKVRMVIDMNSVSTSYKDFTATLLTSDWFDVKLFPQAIFEATHFTKMGDNKYQANGTLTIRDKKVPITFTFTSQALSKTKNKIQGTVTLKRTQFGVGQGEWSSTDAVKDDVEVNFVITAVS